MGVAKSMTLRGGGGGGPTLSVTMTLIFPKIVWTCPLTLPVIVQFLHGIIAVTEGGDESALTP